MEIKTPLLKFVSEPQGDEYHVITDSHTIADVLRWLVGEAGSEEALRAELGVLDTQGVQ